MTYLTERQRDVLHFIERWVTERGVAPTLREIAAEFEFSSTASAQKHVALLERKGFLQRHKHQKRGLALTSVVDHDDQPGVELPLMGTVAAGYPIEAIADAEPIRVPADMIRSGRHYVLRVAGDSMIGEGILDGDFVVVQSRNQAADGETVVALVNGEATLKRLYRQPPDRIRLQPANPSMPPLLVAADDLMVQGVVVGLLRRY